MAGNLFGNNFRIMTYGESHGKALGVVIDGAPAGLDLCEEDIQIFLDRRKPGNSQFATKRSEADLVHITSGVFEGKTTGTPISLVIENTDHRSADYSEIMSYYRPGHADYTFDEKYGFRDYRGGGRSSGRETAARVAAGAVAIKILNNLGIEIGAYVKSIGNIECESIDYEFSKNNELCMADKKAYEESCKYLEGLMEEKDSAGGVVECFVKGMPAGIGEPVFDKISANLAKAVFSIGAVKGFEIGDGFLATKNPGTVNNDNFCMEDGHVKKMTNHSGGTLGGMSDGSDIIFRAAFKPTPSVASIQNTVNKSGEDIQISIKGRHDPLVCARAVVVVESMAALTILDSLISNMSARLDYLVDFYK